MENHLPSNSFSWGIQNLSFWVCWWRPGFPLPSATPVLTTRFVPAIYLEVICQSYEVWTLGKEGPFPKSNEGQLGSMYVKIMISGYITTRQRQRFVVTLGMLPFLQVLNISPPKDSRRDARACQAKRLKINKEMQTFMKDSKSSRKAAGIPRENNKTKCVLYS